jgi:superfamily II DNA or RNA helicase
LLVAPTGAGKTTIAAFIIAAAVERGERVLFVAHRRELIAQAHRRLLDLGLAADDVGVIMANDPRRRPGAACRSGVSTRCGIGQSRAPMLCSSMNATAR